MSRMSKMGRQSKFGGLSALDEMSVNSVDMEDGQLLNLKGFEKKVHKMQVAFDRIVKSLKPYILDHAV